MPHMIIHPPRITREVFRDVLERAGSPAAHDADALFRVCVEAGIDPAVALAFFAHESAYGTRGITAKHRTHNWGNMRRPFAQSRCSQIINSTAGPYASYPNWVEGLADWCDLIRFQYVDRWNLPRTDQALVRYAPPGQSDAPAAYSAHVDALMAEWMARSGDATALPPGASPVDPRFEEAWARSGGAWKPRQLTPGYAVDAAVTYNGLLHQEFQRGVCRVEASGQTSWLTLQEIYEFKQRSST